MLWLALLIIALLVLAVVTLVFTSGQRKSATGALSRETRSRDRAAVPVSSAGTELELSGEARARASEASASATAVMPRGETAVAEWQPIDEEQLGVSRRQFLNRAILTMVGVGGLAPFGGALLAFIWPFSSGGFGGKVAVGNLSDMLAQIASTQEPFYAAGARTYIAPYPTDPATQSNATGAYEDPTIQGMTEGFVALWQKCPHLGCRVPWCKSAQWFECPCHGSKYNRVGEKRDGPAPRGMDRFPVEISGGNVTVNTGAPIQGPPIGVDTTGQKAEGAHCV
jgi:cytochrome b6-f complex iron-sulfur subunit